MTSELALLPSRRAVAYLDAVAVLTVAAFVALGVLAGVELTRLAGLGTSLLDAATALDQVGRALGSLSQIPFLGSATSGLAQSVQQTATSTRAGATDASSAVHTLAVVIGLAIALIPLPALLAGYLPLRLARVRAVGGLRRSVAAGRPVDPMLVTYLAHRAVARLPFGRLREASPDPFGDLAAGRPHRLAAAELRRIGVRPPADWTGR